MKKIFLLPLFVSLICVADAFGDRNSCGPVTVSFKTSQGPDDNEFLYANINEYNLTKIGYENTGTETSGSGHAYECDNKTGCAKNAVIEMPAGHVFNKEVIDKQVKYICVIGFMDDYWKVYTGDVCKNSRLGEMNIGSVKKDVNFEDCSGLRTTTGFDFVTKWNIHCDKGPEFVCRPASCIDGYVVSADGNKCEPKKLEPVAPAQCTGANEINAPEEIILTTVCPECQQIKKDQCVDKDMFACYKAIKYRPNNAKWNAVWNDVNACICTPATKYEWDRDSGTCIEKKQSGLCEQLRIQGASAERLACCRAGNATTWKSGASITSTDASNCTCVDTSKKWDGKSCVDDKLNNNFGGNDNCELQTLDYISCLNGREIIKGTKITISAKDLEGMSCAEFGLKYSGNIDFLRGKFCNDSRYSREVVLDAQTKKAIENMNAFFKMAEEDTTVWRTEEGKFNTARLASDATAGVVLGTVGGVVSAKVIKKNQLEKGYDALKCTIGGQKMADWGDVFNVGLRR